MKNSNGSNSNFKRTHGRSGSFNDALKEIRREQREQREKEIASLRENRLEDLQLLSTICEALNNRIGEVMKLQLEAEASNRQLTKEETKISLHDVEAHFKAMGQQFPMKNRITVLIAPLVDLAKCQANTKLLDYHVAIRMIYFGERFQAYFSPEFDQTRYDLMKRFGDFLFFTWNLTHVAFINYTPGNDDATPLSDMLPWNSLVMPINLVGIDVQVTKHKDLSEDSNFETCDNESDGTDEELEKKADSEAEENGCGCENCDGNCDCHSETE